MATEAALAAKDSAALSEICCLHCEMEAVVEALFDALEAIDLMPPDNRRKVERAMALTMALNRSIREVGRQAGAI